MRNLLAFLVGIRELEFRIKVVTGSSRSEIVGASADGTLKMKVAATEESGRVNDELHAYLAKQYGVQKSAVTTYSGKNSSLKVVRIATCAPAAPPRPRRAGVGFDINSLLPVQ